MHGGQESSQGGSAEPWKYQLRLQLTEEVAQAARSNEQDPTLLPLYGILESHSASIVCQFDAFAGYCEQAERLGEHHLPLYKWTKATIEDPVKQAKYVKIFTIYVNDQEVYEKQAADALEAELRPLEGGPVVEKLSKYDSNPANNPQPPKKYRS